MPKEINVKTVLNKSKKRDSWFLSDYTINMYSGCSFNCLYCYIRGSKYGFNMAEKTSVKINALEKLDRQLFNRAKKQQYGFIVLSSATDPYLHFEAEYKLTRQALELIAKHRFPVHVLTKSDLITRDFDLLEKISQTAILPDDLKPRLSQGTIISFSFSILDDAVAKIFEPGATAPTLRLKALQSAKENGFLTGVSLMPLLPFISDTTASLEQFFSTFKTCGVDFILPATITLFGNTPADSKSLVLAKIAKHFPELVPRYQSYFKNSHALPAFYRNAFDKKIDELCAEYQLNRWIGEKL